MSADSLPPEAPKGSRENPLSVLDLPYTVPETGRYWITYGSTEPEMTARGGGFGGLGPFLILVAVFCVVVYAVLIARLA